MSEEFEELEQIPWAALAARTPDPRLRLALIVVSACSIVVLLLVIGKVMLSGDGDPGDVPAIPTEHLAAAPSPEPASDSAEPAPVVANPETPSPPGAYSEADLMAISPGTEERLAAVWAEWFVRDYLAGEGADPAGFRIPDTPSANLPAGGTPVFVEWVNAFAVTSPSPGSYRVEVAYRVLVETDAGFIRRPAAALAAEVAVGVDGAIRLLHLPEPIPLPERSIAPVPILSEDLPADVLEGISDTNQVESVVGGYQSDGSWHVLVVGEIVPGVGRVYRVVVPQT